MNINRFVRNDGDGSVTGGLAGYLKRGIIKNCRVIESTIEGYDSGGIAGSAGSEIVSGCYAIGNVSGKRYAGGLIGEASDSDITASFTAVKLNEHISEGISAGGLVGISQYNTNISKCYTIVAPITTRSKMRSLPVHVKISSRDGIPYNSYVLLEQIRVIDRSRLMEYICCLTSAEMKKINKAVMISCGGGVSGDKKSRQ